MKTLKIIAFAVAAAIVVAISAYIFIPVRGITITDVTDQEMYVGEECGYMFSIHGGWLTNIKKLRVVADNPEVADVKCTLEGLGVVQYPTISITPKSKGTMTFHIETKDGKVKSNETTINVKRRK